jgi:hypothetical protein
MAVSLVLNVFLFFACIRCLVHCECPRNGTCCDQFQCEYSLYKKLVELESKLGSLESQLEGNFIDIHKLVFELIIPVLVKQ